MEDVTKRFAAVEDKSQIKEILSAVYNALLVKGYNLSLIHI